MKNIKKRISKFVSLLTIISLITTMFSGVAFANTQATLEVWNGAYNRDAEPAYDSLNSCYLIANGAELSWFAYNYNNGGTMASHNALLVSDIDLGGKQWSSIGNDTYPFAGELDGAGYVIYNFYQYNPGKYGGLVGNTSSGAYIHNLGMEDGSIRITNGGTVGSYQGLIAGNLGGTSNIQDCYIAGISSVYVNMLSNSNIVCLGGIAGSTYYSASIKNVYTNANVSCYNGSYRVTTSNGAVCGSNSGKTENCYYKEGVAVTSSKGNGSGNKDGAFSETEEDIKSGKIAYELGSSWGQIIDEQDYPVLVRTGVSNKVYAIQLSGLFDKTIYANKILDLMTLDFGGYDNVRFYKGTDNTGEELAGTISDVSAISDIYTTGTLKKFNLVLKSDDQEYKSLDVEYKADLFDILDNEDPSKTNYVFKEWKLDGEYTTMPAHNVTATAVFDMNTQNVDGKDYFLIYDAQQLGMFRDKVNNGNNMINGMLMKDIDLSDACNENLSGWETIGLRGVNLFCGTFDGNGHVVKGLYIDNSNGDSMGLFGGIYGIDDSNPVTIKNLGIIDSTINGQIRVGSIAGYAWKAVIENCYSNATLSGEYVAGIVGQGYFVHINKCFFTGSVTGSNYQMGYQIYNGYHDYAAGIVGWLGNISSISDSYNMGEINGAGCTGGILALNSCDEGTLSISNCYNSGTLNGGAFMGGCIGSNDYSCDITNFYNAGKINGELNENVGGIIGVESSAMPSTITNTYYDKDLTDAGIVDDNNQAMSDEEGKFEGESIKNMTGATATMGNISSDAADWVTTDKNGTILYTPQLNVFASSSNEYVKEKSLQSVTQQMLTVSYDGNGNTSGNIPEDGGLYREGYEVSVLFDKIPVKTNYLFSGWSTSSTALVADYTSDGVKTFDMPNQNTKLYAVWSAMQTVVTPVISFNPTASDNKYDYETDVKATITCGTAGAKIFYSLDNGATYKEYKGEVDITPSSVNGGGVGIKAYATATDMLNSQTASATATFRAKKYSVTVGTIKNGTLTSDMTTARAGEKIILTPTPDAIYEVKTLTYNNINITAVNGEYSFIMPAENVVINAEYVLKKFNVYLMIDGLEKPITVKEVGSTFSVSALDIIEKEFLKWTVTGVNIEDVTSKDISFAMPENDVQLKAEYKVKTYSITYDGNGSTSGEIPTDSNLYAKNQDVSVIFDNTLVKKDYIFCGWSMNSTASVADYTSNGVKIFNMPGRNIKLYAVWEAMQPVETPVITFTPANLDNTYDYEIDVKAAITCGTAGAKIYYSLDNGASYSEYTGPINIKPGSADGGIVEVKAYAKATDNLDSQTTSASATFRAKKYSVTIGTVANGTVTVDKTTARAGEKVTLTVTPMSIYELKSLTYNNNNLTANGEEYSFAMPAENVIVNAEFKLKTYSVVYDGNGNTSGDAPTDNKVYSQGQDVFVIFEHTLVKVDHLFMGWSTNVSATQAEFTKDGISSIKMPGQPLSLYAVWAAMQSVAAPVVTFSPLNSDNIYDYGTDITTTITCETAGAKIFYSLDGGKTYKEYTDKITLNSSSVIGETIEIKAYATATDMKDSKTALASASFRAKSYNVTIGTITNGIVTPDKTTASAGEKITLTVCPDSNYVLSSLTYNNNNVDVNNGEYSFVMSAEDVVINATMSEIIKYNVYLSVDGEEKPVTKMEAEDTYSLSAPEIEGKEFVKWTVTGVNIADETSKELSFIMPEEDVYITAEYKVVEEQMPEKDEPEEEVPEEEVPEEEVPEEEVPEEEVPEEEVPEEEVPEEPDQEDPIVEEPIDQEEPEKEQTSAPKTSDVNAKNLFGMFAIAGITTVVAKRRKRLSKNK